ncbi:MAG TPA: DMT family transporter [Mycobacteriales bacterium]|nr:DMT family transporter [Mycobacteriales bacterium]
MLTRPVSLGIATALAVIAGATFAGASVLQQRAARGAPPADALRPRLILDLLHRRDWLAGSGAGAAGFGFQAVALYLGPITLVQPLIITELLFALPVSARLAGRRLSPREWLGASLVVGGLAGFLITAAPSQSTRPLDTGRWLLVMAAVVPIVGAALLLAPHRPGLTRTSMLAVGTGVTFGVMATLTKAAGTLFAERGVVAVTNWQPWALAVVACTGVLLSQSAFQAGPLAVSLPLIDVLIPLSASVIAVTAFHERIGHTDVDIPVELFAGAAVIAGIALLDTSPLVRRAQRSDAGAMQ